jgi:hypothetical protein
MIGERNQASKSCDASIDDDSFTWNFEPLPELALGDESQAWVMSSEGFPGREEAWLYISWIRRGDNLAFIVYSPMGFRFPGSPAIEDFELEQFKELATVVDNKFATLDD